MTYLEYRQRLELGHADYDEIDAFCRKLKIAWFASVSPPTDPEGEPVFAESEIILQLHDEDDSGRLFKMKEW